MLKKEIHILIDYKGQFGSKSDAKHYRSGMDINLLMGFFSKRGFVPKVIKYSAIDLRNDNWNNKIIIYTSQEDPKYYYKSYIEDIIYALELSGAKLIPLYKFLRSNNNKVFMELYRDLSGNPLLQNIKSYHFGTHEELLDNNLNYSDKYVLKRSEGAKSRGVFLGNGKEKTERISKIISKSPIFMQDLKDKLRPYKHKGYIRNSTNRKKFIVQNFVEGLTNDWKILVFGKKFYIEYRGVRSNDFRASGSQNFFLNDDIPVPIPNGIFEFARKVRDIFNTPHLSLDIGFNEKEFFLFEFQALYFSSYAHRKSTCYYH